MDLTQMLYISGIYSFIFKNNVTILTMFKFKTNKQIKETKIVPS